MAQLDWDGDKGVETLLGIYIQHPLQNFITCFHTCPSTAALSSTMSQDQHEVSVAPIINNDRLYIMGPSEYLEPCLFILDPWGLIIYNS